MVKLSPKLAAQNNVQYRRPSLFDTNFESDHSAFYPTKIKSSELVKIMFFLFPIKSSQKTMFYFPDTISTQKRKLVLYLITIPTSPFSLCHSFFASQLVLQPRSPPLFNPINNEPIIARHQKKPLSYRVPILDC